MAGDAADIDVGVRNRKTAMSTNSHNDDGAPPKVLDYQPHQRKTNASRSQRGMLPGVIGLLLPFACIPFVKDDSIWALVVLLASLSCFGIQVVISFHRVPIGGKNRLRVRPGALALGVLPLVLFLAATIVLPQMGASKEQPNRRKCARNLQAIGSAIQLYVNDHRRYPPDLIQTLLNANADAALLVCPSSNEDTAPGASIKEQAAHLSKPEHCSYIYLGAGLTPAITTPETILVVEKPASHEGEGVHVLHVDGRVEWVPRGPRMDAIVAATTRPATAPGAGGSQ